MVGLAMIVVGLAAAFGISQLITDDAAVTGSPVATLHSEAPAYAQSLGKSPVATLGGAAPAYAQAAERGAAMGANTDTLIRNGLAQQQAIGVTTWTVADELAALHGRTGTEPRSNVGSTGLQPTPEQASAAFHGRTGTQPTANVGVAAYKPTAEQQLAAIEARTGVIQGAVSGELGWSADELAGFHARNGFEPVTYAEQPSGPK